MAEKEEKQSNGTEFLIGIILLGIGLFILSRKVIVTSGWFRWTIGSFDFSSGLVVVPLMIGIIWWFYKPKSILPKILMVLGGLFILVTIIMSVQIHFVATSLFDYLLILAMVAAGVGLILRARGK